MANNKNTGNTGQIPFADIAMSVMGPMAFLMIIFLIIAARAANAPCKNPDAKNIQLLAAKIEQWVNNLEKQNESYKLLLNLSNCYVHRDGGDIGLDAAELNIPHLHGICNDKVNEVMKILEKSGLNKERITKRIRMGRMLNHDLVKCVEDRSDEKPPCISPDASEMDKIAEELTKWTSDLTDKNIKYRDMLIERCGDSKEPFNIDTESLRLVAPPLFGICKQNIDEIMNRAGLNAKTIKSEIALREVSVEKLALCLAENTDVVTIPSKKVEFESCSIRFVNPKTGRIMDPEDKNEFFNEITATVAKVLDEKPIYNRIDIFGHTDASPVRKGGRCYDWCNCITDNEKLSVMRAIAFQKELKEAFRRSNVKLHEQIRSGKLKMYAIGVGDREQLFPGVLKGKKARQNRRIEISFARDKRMRKR